MTRYFFDIYDGDNTALDEEGLELPDVRTAQEEAARSLADLVRDSGRAFPEVAIQVRDCSGPIVAAKFVWETSARRH